MQDAAAQISIRLNAATRGGERSLTMELRPEELGRVAVKLDFHEGNVISVQMTMDREDTYQAFRHNQPSIEHQLTQSGLDLGGGLDLRFGQHNQQSQSGDAGASARLAARVNDADPFNEANHGSSETAQPQPRQPAASLIDISA